MLPTKPFGRTAHDSTRAIFGAAALGSMSPERAAATLEIVDRYGVNHIDTAAGYGDSELRLAPWLASARSRVFLATKTGERHGDAARRQLEASLQRMEVDHVDLIQLHNLVEADEWEGAFAPGGAVAALAQARSEGLCRFIGVTGHGLRIPSMHVRSLHAFDFDSVLLPYNFVLMQQPEYRADVEELLELCTARNVAVQTIKSVARRRWSGSRDGKRSWYEPLTDAGAISRAVRYVLGDDRLFVNTSSDAGLLPLVLDAVAAASGPPPAPAELQRDVEDLGIAPLFDGAALERI